jgi:hypothetical protein
LQQQRELVRVVPSDLCAEVDTNWYSVLCQFIGAEVLVLVADQTGTISHAGELLAVHRRLTGRRERSAVREHFSGPKLYRKGSDVPASEIGELLRPLADTLVFLCEAEIARKDQRRIATALSIA